MEGYKKMTYEEKVNKSLIDANLDVDNLNNQDKLVYIAYYMGCESAVKELIDMQIQPSLINNYNQDFTKKVGSDLYRREEDADE